MTWNEQDHPRVPAGKNAGGQWTKIGSVQFKYSVVAEEDAGEDVITDVDDINYEVSSLLESARDEAEVYYVVDEQGNGIGFFSGGLDPTYEDEDVFVLMYLGAQRPWGPWVFIEAVRRAVKEAADKIRLDSDSSTTRFYEGMGLHKTSVGNGWSVFELDRAEMKSFLKAFDEANK